jgi:hypothetical protein
MQGSVQNQEGGGNQGRGFLAELASALLDRWSSERDEATLRMESILADNIPTVQELWHHYALTGIREIEDWLASE